MPDDRLQGIATQRDWFMVGANERSPGAAAVLWGNRSMRCGGLEPTGIADREGAAGLFGVATP